MENSPPTPLPHEAPTTAPSLRNNFAARFASDIYGLVTSILATSVTARVLGPSGRGYYATLVLLSVLFTQLFGAGLGEAATVLPQRRRGAYPMAMPTTMAAILPLSVIGAAACVLSGMVTLEPATRDESTALALAGLLVLLNTCSNTLAWFLIARERLVLVAAMTVMSATIIIGSLALFLIVLELEVSGAVVASVVGTAAILGMLLWYLPREGVSLRFGWDPEYLRAATRFGLSIQLSNLLVQLAGRLDLIFVYRIVGSASAGMYSVALTLGTLVGSVPIAIAHAAFPRLARVTEDEARALTGTLFRGGIFAALSTCVAIGVLTPIALPVVLGAPYRDAIAPTLVLLPAGVFWSGQWILSRAAAARERPRPLVVSFAASFIIMVLLDVALIPHFGITGAAVASLLASGAGFVIALTYLLRAGWPYRLFLPGVADWVLLVHTVRQMLRSVRRGGPAASGPPLSASGGQE